MRATLTRRVCFDARHRFWRPDWDAARNRAAFGAASEDHGHRYTCAVTLAGHLPPDGALADLARLDALLADLVVAPLAGRHLNEALPEFAYGRLLPTCEAIAAWCWARIAPAVPAGVELVEVLIAEDDTLEGGCGGPA